MREKNELGTYPLGEVTAKKREGREREAWARGGSSILRGPTFDLQQVVPLLICLPPPHGLQNEGGEGFEASSHV
jgi:hypothetical protein